MTNKVNVLGWTYSKLHDYAIIAFCMGINELSCGVCSLLLLALLILNSWTKQLCCISSCLRRSVCLTLTCATYLLLPVHLIYYVEESIMKKNSLFSEYLTVFIRMQQMCFHFVTIIIL